MIKKVPFLLIIAVNLLLLPVANSVAQSNEEYVMPLQGPTWNHSTIKVLIVPRWNETWWQSGYLDSAVRSISQWNDAVIHFSQNNSDFSYIARLEVAMKISNSTEKGFDIYVSWIDRFRNETCEAGLTRTIYSSNVVINCTLTLAAHDCYGNVMSERDVQNVALHEFGHTLGLGHPNIPEDLMYFAYSLSSPAREISTLDAYGVTQVFRWMANSSEFNPDNQGQPIYSVTLPADISYEFLPVSTDNVPPQTTTERVRTFLDDLVQFILMPEFIILMVIIIVALLIYLAATSLRRKTHDA